MKQKIVKYISIPIVLIVIIMMVVSMFTSSLIMILSGGEEEEESNQTIEYDASPISGAVEALRDDILKELKKYNKEQYIDLVLALVMQESGGEGEDVFQCSESLGKKPNSIGKKQSIEHGVKVLCNLMNDKRIKVASPNDLEKIKIVLQAYNYGGGYVDYINETNFGRSVTKEQLENIGKWTQDNALSYQEKKSAESNHGYPVARTGSAATILGPYAYGDAYYVKHVLRYYPNAENSASKFTGKVGDAAKVAYADKQKYIWGNSNPPISATEAQKYLTTISVPIINENGKKTTMNLTVHARLATEFKAVFEDMVKAKFRIKASETCAYVWKNIIGTGTVSQHSYGLAIDINWNDNPCFYNTNVDVTKGYGGYRPGKNKYSVTQKVIKIWKSHGFYWGGDWSGKKDTMHFSYTEKPG
ncbi:lysozyme family protein [uncultured Eubacterium sp.]|uniref:lysozyme family protein n=1 Tax=uncultured Eubacterium sp. TaxID=165185 RepID=UPI002601C676|nr:lysozyme family protein [uncultured Eubacterium sp.]